MRGKLILVLMLGLAIGKERGYKFKTNVMTKEAYLSVNGQPEATDIRNAITNSRNDTTTVWFDDLEGDLIEEGWTLDSGWVHSNAQNWSPTHSLNFDDDFMDGYQYAVSPLIALPEIAENEILKYTFALRADMPDSDGDGDNSLEDLYYSLIGDSSDVVQGPQFHPSTNGAYEGNSWWCADETIGGYANDWIQYLDTPPINIPADNYVLKAYLQWSIESPRSASGSSVTEDYPCLDGWDAANVRISTDGGNSWSLLTADSPADSYHFNHGYGWIWNDSDYGCDGPLSDLAAGWASTQISDAAPVEDVDWHEVKFDLSAYANQNVIIRFAFGSDPAYSTIDGDPEDGFRIDNIRVEDSAGEFDPIFSDNADGDLLMIPGYEEVESGLDLYYGFYDYGDNTRPGGVDWEMYEPGMPYNNNTQLDISPWAGDTVQMVFVGITDDNSDGGDGAGLFIDDIHIWKVKISDIPEPTNLQAEAIDNSITVSWSAPPGGSYENDGITYNDGSFESGVSMTSGSAVFGTLFSMPYGIDSVIVHSVEVFGGGGGTVRVSGYPVTLGTPDDFPTNQVPVVTAADSWVSADNLGWTFPRSFVIGVELDTINNVLMNIDRDGAPSSNSFVNFGGWEPWSTFVVDTELDDGEFGIRATVSTVGSGLTPQFKVYRSPYPGPEEYDLVFNWSTIGSNTQYFDEFDIQYGTEYCYKVSAIYDNEEGSIVGPICVTPETNTTYALFHDDGSSEESMSGGGVGGAMAVRFTPNNYPVSVYRARLFSALPSAVTAFLKVWSANADGFPGDPLSGNIPIQLDPGWTEVSLDDLGININSGSFFIGVVEGFTSTAIGVDMNSTSETSVVSVTQMGWENLITYVPGVLMIRAEVDSAGQLSNEDRLDDLMPFEFGLKQNYPNPFNPATTIEFSTAENSWANLAIYNLLGEQVKVLVNERLEIGNYKYTFLAKDLPSGVYFYQLNIGTRDKPIYSDKKKLVLLK